MLAQGFPALQGLKAQQGTCLLHADRSINFLIRLRPSCGTVLQALWGCGCCERLASLACTSWGPLASSPPPPIASCGTIGDSAARCAWPCMHTGSPTHACNPATDRKGSPPPATALGSAMVRCGLLPLGCILAGSRARRPATHCLVHRFWLPLGRQGWPGTSISTLPPCLFLG